MPDDIPSHYSTEFSSNWITRLQQEKSRLDAFIMYEDFNGERKRYDRLSSQASAERTERKGPTRITEAGMDSRWAYRRSYDLANLLDADDAKNLAPLTLPTSDYIRAHAAAYNRNADDLACSTAAGGVYTGEAGTTLTPFPSTQAIAAGGTGLTLGKLLTAREIMDKSELDDNVPEVIVVSAQQIGNLLNTTEVKNVDYNTVKALAAGQIDTFCGFKFIKNNRLPKVGTIRTIVGWAKGAIKMTRGPKEAGIVTRHDLSDSIQVRSTWHLGGTRVHDECVFTIDCVEV